MRKGWTCRNLIFRDGSGGARRAPDASPLPQAAQIHATLGMAEAPAPIAGEVMPPLWHWCAFVPTVPTEELGRDGHPKLGGFLPPVPLQRRMWASADLRFHQPLHVGETLTRHSVIRSVEEKAGASGPMVLVTVAHELHGADGLAIEEVQNIVYLDIPDTYSPPRKRPMPETPLRHDTVEASEVLLFRYSALTFNAHRIHIDLPYAQEVERYPGLVVHGPLQAIWLIQAAHRARGHGPTGFRFAACIRCFWCAVKARRSISWPSRAMRAGWRFMPGRRGINALWPRQHGRVSNERNSQRHARGRGIGLRRRAAGGDDAGADGRRGDPLRPDRRRP